MQKKMREVLKDIMPETKPMKLGVSIYPEHSNFEDDKAYLEKAAALGYTRVFTCLLSVGDDIDQIVDEFTKINKVAGDLGMEVIFDVNPLVFDKLGVKGNDLQVFKDMHAAGLRLDMGTGIEGDVALTNNPQGLFIETNASMMSNYFDDMREAGANMDKLITCHNFYPQRYTGLGWDFFKKASKQISEQKLHLAAFVSSRQPHTFGPWPVNEGLPTVEMHRDLPIDLQARHMLATGYIDDVIIGNAFASDEELELLSKVSREYVGVKVTPSANLSDNETKLLFEELHFIRPDSSDMVHRSLTTRFIYGDQSLEPNNTSVNLKRGDIIVINDQLEHYRGEVQIVLEDRIDDGRANVIGRIKPDEMIMLDVIKPGQVIKFLK